MCWHEKFGDTPEAVFQRFMQNKVIGLGWAIVGDLRVLRPSSPRQISDIIKDDPEFYELRNWISGGHSLYGLYHDMRIGDLIIIVVGPKRRTVVEVIGEYYYTEDNLLIEDELYHRRRVGETRIDPDTLWRQHSEAFPGWSLRWALTKLR